MAFSEDLAQVASDSHLELLSSPRSRAISRRKLPNPLVESDLFGSWGHGELLSRLPGVSFLLTLVCLEVRLKLFERAVHATHHVLPHSGLGSIRVTFDKHFHQVLMQASEAWIYSRTAKPGRR